MVIVVIIVNVSKMEKEDMVRHDGEVVYVGQNR